MASTVPGDPYEILGVAGDADEQAIKKSFRALARELHPDVNSHDPDAEAKFKDAGESYEVLKDPEKRAAYNELGANWKQGAEFRPPPGWPGPFEAALTGLSNRERRAINLLYGSGDSDITYYDIYELLRQTLGDGGVPDVVLLGTHGEDAGENPLLTQVVRGIVEGWPPPPFRISGRDEGREGATYFLGEETRPGAAFQKAFTQVLRRCGVHCGRGPAVYRLGLSAREQTVETVIPDAHDRRVTALRSVYGHSPLLYRSSVMLEQL